MELACSYFYVYIMVHASFHLDFIFVLEFLIHLPSS